VIDIDGAPELRHESSLVPLFVDAEFDGVKSDLTLGVRSFPE